MSVSLKKKKAGNRNTNRLIERIMTFIIPMKWLSNPELGWNGGYNLKKILGVRFWLWATCTIIWFVFGIMLGIYDLYNGSAALLPTVVVCLGILAGELVRYTAIRDNGFSSF